MANDTPIETILNELSDFLNRVIQALLGNAGQKDDAAYKPVKLGFFNANPALFANKSAIETVKKVAGLFYLRLRHGARVDGRQCRSLGAVALGQHPVARRRTGDRGPGLPGRLPGGAAPGDRGGQLPDGEDQGHGAPRAERIGEK